MIDERPSPWARIRGHVMVFDGPLMFALALLVALSLVTMYSAALDYDGRLQDHVRNLLIAFAIMGVAAN
ncbi:MAG TPA: rod shape-determining protein RodA, partial [Zeimonas sp.]|nr:rod shape-determining protein RodA [Zeimonas sp.]